MEEPRRLADERDVRGDISVLFKYNGGGTGEGVDNEVNHSGFKLVD